jgi:hypothetical protein
MQWSSKASDQNGKKRYPQGVPLLALDVPMTKDGRSRALHPDLSNAACLPAKRGYSHELIEDYLISKSGIASM